MFKFFIHKMRFPMAQGMSMQRLLPLAVGIKCKWQECKIHESLHAWTAVRSPPAWTGLGFVANQAYVT